MKNKRKILFFGATSFAAEDLIGYLKKKYEIINVSRKKHINCKNIKFDLNKINNSIGKINKLKNIHYIFYFSSFVPSKEKDSSMRKCLDINVYGIIEFLKKLKLKPKKIILASSNSVYGNSEKIKKENDILYPDNSYAISKYLQENIFRIYCRENMIKLITLRIGNIYGKNLNKKRIVSKIIYKIKNKVFFKTYNENDKVFNLVHTKDIGKIVYKLLTKEQGVYNLSGQENLSLNQIIKIISKKLNQRAYYKNINYKNKRKKNSLSVKKIKNILRIKHLIKFEDGVKDLL